MKHLDYQALLEARIITTSRYRQLLRVTSLTPQEQLSVERYEICGELGILPLMLTWETLVFWFEEDGVAWLM